MSEDIRTPPELEFAFEITARIEPTVHIGRSAGEAARFTAVVGGTVEGPRLNGTVLSGGGDWSVHRSGTSQLEARYLLRADDGSVIDIINRGYYRGGPPEYFRTSPSFQTDAPAHRWLAENQFVGRLRADDEGIHIAVFLVH